MKNSGQTQPCSFFDSSGLRTSESSGSAGEMEDQFWRALDSSTPNIETLETSVAGFSQIDRKTEMKWDCQAVMVCLVKSSVEY